MIKNKSGIWGEVYAARYLHDNGYRTLSSNYKTRHGEIDLVAKKDDTLYFFEVKTRGENPRFAAFEAVDAAKQSRILLASQSYISSYNHPYKSVSFDVIEVYLTQENKVEKINHIENAF